MLNQVVLVGRVLEISNIVEEVTIKIPRTFKNEEGVYEEDNIRIKTSIEVFSKIQEYCKKDDIIGVKGRVEQEGYNNIILAEKITFLSSKGGE